MKYYKIKRTNKTDYEEIKFDDFYVSQDLSFISGTTSPTYNFSSTETVGITTPYTNGVMVNVQMETQDVLRQGYCDYDFPYEVLTNDNDMEYIYYNNGKPYYKQDNGKFLVNGNEYAQDGNYVRIPTRYYVYDNILRIGGVAYDIDIDERSDSFNQLLTLENGDIVTVIYYVKDTTVNLYQNREEPTDSYNRKIIDSERVTLFKIGRGENMKLSVDSVSCCKDVGYIIYCKQKYYLAYDDANNIGVKINDKWYYPSQNVENDDIIDVNGDIFVVRYETVAVPIGSNIMIYLSTPVSLNTNVPITCIGTESINNFYIVLGEDENNPYIIYNGNRYTIQDDIIHKLKVDENDPENPDYYLIHYNDDGEYAYITVNGADVYFRVKDENTLVKDTFTENGFEEKEYEIVKSKGVIINGNAYEMFENNVIDDNGASMTQNYVSILEKPIYFLTINDIKNNYLVRCSVDLDGNGLDENEYEAEASKIINTIVQNDGLFDFYSTNAPFGYKVILDKEKKDYAPKNSQYEDIPSDIENDLHIYKIYDYFSIPLVLDNDSGININQEQTVEDYFFTKEVDKAVNGTLDMEKDIYYPSYKMSDNQFQNLPLVNEIIFNLHFRTRNLDTWKVIEDENDNTERDTIVSKNCNWFIMDYYVGDLTLSNEDKLRASDLLGFLDFTNDDVFYQKSKIGKSFLRLTFWDSPDPKRQSLLHSATVFMNEGALYNKYINNVKNGEFVTIIENNESLSRANNLGISTSVSVDTEVIENSKVIIDDEKRLSSQFILKNRYEEETSSEGFYIYMFKNMSDNLHERNIYMKVEFNHAGIGRTIPFILPMDTENNIPLDLTNDEAWEELKKGVKLNELYKHIYIELKMVYDAVNNRYVYYRPQTATDNKMVFNLFELKISNENETV